MPRERQLHFGSENAHAPSVGALFGREDEDGFRVVELARDRLHLRVRQTTRIRNYSERIPAVKMIGEDVGSVEGVRHAPKNVRRAGARGYQWS